MFFGLRFIAASSLSAWFLDEERIRVPLAGGGGGNAVCATAGELDCMRAGFGDLRSSPDRIAPSGDIVVVALLGVVPLEKSVEGEIVSADEGPSASAEYGGGGDDIGSVYSNEQANFAKT